MGTAERRQREKLQRQTTIVNAAEKIIFEKGLQKATMDEIAAEAELSKGTLYLYFTSKEQLYMAIIQRAMSTLTSLFRKATDIDGTGVEKVYSIGRAYYQFFLDYPNYFNALMYYENLEIDLETTDEIVRYCLMNGDENLTILIKAIEEGQADGSVKKELDPVKTALLLWTQTTGVVLGASAKKDIIENHYKVKYDDLIDNFFEFVGIALSN